MSGLNGSQMCEGMESLFDSSTSTCFDSIPRPNLSDCHLLLVIHRLILFDCYFERLFFPLTGILILLGTILNLFSLYCFLKMNKRNSQNVYLSVLSLGDTINLHINFTVPLLRQNDRIDDYFHSSPILCRFHGFLMEFFLIFPTWIIVLLTFERLICVLSPLKCHSVYTQRRAKVSIGILASLVMCLCLYRFYDLKGIDQASVFSIVACDDGAPIELGFLRNFNLIIWAILPECLTLMMNLVIIYNIKLATQRFEPFYSKARQSKYNQATKTVLLISILFLICHTPTGILIGLNMLYSTGERTVGLTIILVSRKLTVIFYEISLCCKFFIYNRTFRNFKNILRVSISRFTRRANSAKLGRSLLDANRPARYSSKSPHRCQHHRTFQFGQIKRYPPGQGGKEIDAILHPPRSSTKTSTSTSRTSREHPPMAMLMIKTQDQIHVSLTETPNLLRRSATGTRITTTTTTSSNRRLLWSSKAQITL